MLVNQTPHHRHRQSQDLDQKDKNQNHRFQKIKTKAGSEVCSVWMLRKGEENKIKIDSQPSITLFSQQPMGELKGRSKVTHWGRIHSPLGDLRAQKDRSDSFYKLHCSDPTALRKRPSRMTSFQAG